MGSRIDIATRRLLQGQNDSAPKEGNDFPGFSRSWNVRGHRATARRRGGYTEAGPGSSIQYGVGGFYSSGPTEWAKAGPTHMPNWVTIGKFWTIDFLAKVDGITASSGTLNLIGGAVGTSPFIEAWFSNLTLNVKVNMASAVSHTFTADLSDGIYFPVRVACDGTKIEFYCAGYGVSTYDGTINDLSADDIWLCSDNARTRVNSGFCFFRMFTEPMFNRAGMKMLYPRPRDKSVVLNLFRDLGQTDLSDGTTSYIQDHSSYHNHAPQNAVMASLAANHNVYNQWAGDQKDGVRIVADGDLIKGDFA